MLEILKRVAAEAPAAMKDALDKIPGKGSADSISSGAFIQTVLNWIYAAAGLVAVGFIVYGAINYVLTQGDPGKVKQAGQTIAFAVIGLIVVLIAASVTNFVIGGIGTL